MSIEEFINETNGQAFDMDGQYGVQCVDGIKKFVDMFKGESNFSCGNGWANGLWLCYGSNGVEKYFNQHPYSEARKGDWIIWNKGSKAAPNSHVGMFIEDMNNGRVRTYGQNQNGIKAFNFCNVEKDGILGVLRLKDLEGDTPTPPPGEYPFDGIIKTGSELFSEDGYKYPSNCKADRDCTVQGELNGKYKVYCEAFDPKVVYTDKSNVIKKGSIYPFTATIKKGSNLYDVNGNRYPSSAKTDKTVEVQGEVNGRYKVYNQYFNPNIVYCDKDAIIR